MIRNALARCTSWQARCGAEGDLTEARYLIAFPRSAGYGLACLRDLAGGAAGLIRERDQQLLVRGKVVEHSGEETRVARDGPYFGRADSGQRKKPTESLGV
jgi:hypothetical protein